MSIYKTTSHIEAYRVIAMRSGSVSELSGRSKRTDLTDFIAGEIMKHLSFKPTDVVVDIGCGDGTLLGKVAAGPGNAITGRLIGILPTKEEVARVSDAVIRNGSYGIQILPGLSSSTGLPDAFADAIVINSVLLVLDGEKEVDATLREIGRIAKPGARVFVGEIPGEDEFVGRTYDDSMSGWLYWVLRKRGPLYYLRNIKKVLVGVFGREPVIISPKRLFFMDPQQFVQKLEQHGLHVIEHRRHAEIDTSGNRIESATRWDYIARRG